jgi:acetyl-CoA synthetase (ADP-forming)
MEGRVRGLFGRERGLRLDPTPELAVEVLAFAAEPLDLTARKSRTVGPRKRDRNLAIGDGPLYAGPAMTHTLSEHESKQLLADAGIPIPEQRLVSSADEAVGAAEELGYPVALKLCGRGIAHKTERNLVRLDVGSAEEVREQAGQLLAERRPEESDSGVLIQAMVPGRRELIAGLMRDAQFGPCVMFGLGGVFAELVKDVVFAVAPLEKHDAADLINALRHREILDAFRGEPEADLAKLANILEALGRIGEARPDVLSIDVNPLILSGSEPVVVDALVELEGDPS